MSEKKERVLTKAELRRKAEFEELKQKLEKEGYRQKDLTIGVLWANVMALVLGLPFVAVAAAVFLWIHPSYGELFSGGSVWEPLLLLAVFFLFIVVHEGIHGLTWSFFAPNHWKSIEFGVIIKNLTPYCCCKEPMKTGAYILGCLMPTIILGGIPVLYSWCSGSFWWLAIGCLMIIGGGGDMEIVRRLLCYRSEKQEKICLDHPYECGVVVFER